LAYISSEKLEKSINNTGLKKQGATNANYSVFTTDSGEKLIQINTYGSDSRSLKGKMSQTIQFNEEVLETFATDMNLISLINNKDGYCMWLKNNRGLEERTVNTYRSNLKRFGNILGNDNYVYLANSEEEVNAMMELFNTNKELQEKNEKEHNGYSSALNRYKEYIIEKQNVIKDNNIEVKNIKYMDSKKVNSSELEKEDLTNILNYINKQGFIYSYEDICNFYLSLKTKPFVILAGISGTGKSKLVKLFAEAVGATSENNQYSLISVKPDWNDSTELLGYKNLNDTFISGKLTEIILDASKEENKNKPYFVCLDEMNLARVEYYLSEYLSLIETRTINENGNVITDLIFPKSLSLNEDLKNLTIPDNLYIIGTVNMDDTTFAFSRKVLDRANTIEFSNVNLELLSFKDDDVTSCEATNDFLRTRFINIKAALNEDKEFTQKINEKIIEINSILKAGNKHFGYRVRDEIVFYMIENKLSDLLSEDEAFDFQIMQKILPTISGSDLSIKDILISLYNYCNTNNQISNDINYIAEAEKGLSAAIYKKSAEKIIMMLRGYEDGFTSFWL